VDCGALSPLTDPERSSIGENAAWRLSGARPATEGSCSSGAARAVGPSTLARGRPVSGWRVTRRIAGQFFFATVNARRRVVTAQVVLCWSVVRSRTPHLDMSDACVACGGIASEAKASERRSSPVARCPVSVLCNIGAVGVVHWNDRVWLAMAGTLGLLGWHRRRSPRLDRAMRTRPFGPLGLRPARDRARHWHRLTKQTRTRLGKRCAPGSTWACCTWTTAEYYGSAVEALVGEVIADDASRCSWSSKIMPTTPPGAALSRTCEKDLKRIRTDYSTAT